MNGGGVVEAKVNGVASAREKKGKKRQKNKERERNVANGAFTMSRRLHMRLLSGLGTHPPRASRALHSRDRRFFTFSPYHVHRSCGTRARARARRPRLFSLLAFLTRSFAPLRRLSVRFPLRTFPLYIAYPTIAPRSSSPLSIPRACARQPKRRDSRDDAIDVSFVSFVRA